MPIFHVSTAQNTVSIASVATGYTINRLVIELPINVHEELCRVLGVTNLNKPAWTKDAVDLSFKSPLYLWYLAERSAEIKKINQEPEQESGLQFYVDLAFSEYMDNAVSREAILT